MTKLAPEWVRTSDPVIRSPARYRWTTAPAYYVHAILAITQSGESVPAQPGQYVIIIPPSSQGVLPGSTQGVIPGSTQCYTGFNTGCDTGFNTKYSV